MCMCPATPTFLLFFHLAPNWHESKLFSFITWQTPWLPTQWPFYLAKEIQGNLGITHHPPTPLTQKKNLDLSKPIMGSSIFFHLGWFRNGLWHNSGQWNVRRRPWGLLRLFPSLLKSSQDSGLSSFSEARKVAPISGPWEQPTLAYEEKPTHGSGRAEGRKETKFFMIPLRGWINSSCPLQVTTTLM